MGPVVSLLFRTHIKTAWHITQCSAADRLTDYLEQANEKGELLTIETH